MLLLPHSEDILLNTDWYSVSTADAESAFHLRGWGGGAAALNAWPHQHVKREVWLPASPP